MANRICAAFRICPVELRKISLAGSALPRRLLALLGLGLALALAGCVSGGKTEVAAPAEPARQTLSEGDVIKVSFPNAPNLDTSQQIRRDGRINLNMVGEVVAADKTPAELEAELVKLYAPQLVSKEIKVTVVSSAYAVFVTGAVLKPGKVTPAKTVTALEAVMEAGGFDLAKANMKAVVVIRHEGGQTQNVKLDLKAALDGKPTKPFFLKSNDIVYVPEKFTWF